MTLLREWTTGFCPLNEIEQSVSELIKHNKDIFESIDDPFALLEKLHIY